MKATYIFPLLLIIITEFIATFDRFAAAMVYSAWLLIFLLSLLYQKAEKENNPRDFAIALTAIAALRILQFTAPMGMLSYNYQILTVYALLLVVSFMYSRHMQISILEMHKFKFRDLAMLLPLIILVFLSSFFWPVSLIIKTMPYSTANLFIILLMSYAQSLFLFGILQNKIQQELGRVSILLVSLLPLILLLNNLEVIPLVFITTLILSFVFYETRNLNLVFIPLFILNMANFVLLRTT